MKLIYQILFFLILFSNCENESISSKYIETEVDNDTTIYEIVEKRPVWKTCEHDINPYICTDKNFLEYLYKNIEYRNYSNNEELENMIIFSFIVEKNGSVSGTEILKGENITNIKEVINKLPYWIPGKNNSKKKRVKLTIPMRLHWDLSN